MAISINTQDMLLKLKERLPPEKRARFANAVASRVSELHTENLMKGALVGAAIGALLEALPGFETLTGIDDCVQVGAALGAWVGNTKDQRVKEERQRVKQVIEECLNEALV
jgi:uncharacterized protein YcfJ